MKLSKQSVIEQAMDSDSLEVLAGKLGMKYTEGFAEEVSKVCPGFEKLIERHTLAKQIQKLKDGGDEDGAKNLRKELIRLTGEVFNLGLRLDKASEKPGKPAKAPKVEKAEKKVTEPVKEEKPAEKIEKAKKTEEPLKVDVISAEEILCEPARAMVLGFIPGMEYLGRSFVYVKLIPGLFGDGVVSRDTLKRFTIHNGIINHSDVRLDEPPTTYWAVMDAMSELLSFTKKQVVELAVKRMIAGGCKDNKERIASGCGIAYDVLKTHQTHPTKKKSGMTHICDDDVNESGEKIVKIRGRRAEETLDFFSDEKATKKKSVKDGKPLKTVYLKDPV